MRRSSRAGSRNPSVLLVLREQFVKEGEALDDGEQEEDVTDSSTSVRLTAPHLCAINYL